MFHFVLWRTPETARTDSPVDFYTKFIVGTRIFSAPEAVGAFTSSKKITSLYTSGGQIGKFLLTTKQVTTAPVYAPTLDGSYTKASLKKGLGKQPPYAYSLKVN